MLLKFIEPGTAAFGPKAHQTQRWKRRKKGLEEGGVPKVLSSLVLEKTQWGVNILSIHEAIGPPFCRPNQKNENFHEKIICLE